MEATNNLYLVYVKYLAQNIDGTYEYELFYSETPDVVWGPFWDDPNPASCPDMTPEESTITKTEKYSSKYKWKTAQETSCMSMEYAIERILALSYIDLDGLEEYPEEGRCVLHFGDTEEEVQKILSTQKETEF